MKNGVGNSIFLVKMELTTPFILFILGIMEKHPHFKRLLELSEVRTSCFLFGPRGTGKTSWLKENFPEALYFDLLEGDLFIDLMSRPSHLEELIPPGHQNYVIIDEIQRVPELLNEVHRLIETKNIPFILTGSSARSLRKKSTNMLGGRALTYHMYPLTCQELGSSFNLQESLQWGNLPSIFSKINPESYLKSYVQTYIKEEVQQEGLTRNLGGFARFLESASFSQGQVVNVAEIAREASLNRKVVENFFSILEDLLIAYHLPIFSRRAKRKLISHRKFYYFDVGIFRQVRPIGPLDSVEESEGAALETLVFQELNAINAYFELGYSLHFWRTAHGVEVDFVLYGKKGLIAIEVKRSTRISPKDLQGLKLFFEDYPEAKLYLFYGGKERQYIDGIEIIPVETALNELPTLLNYFK